MPISLKAVPASLPLGIPCYSSSSLNSHILILNQNLKHCLSAKFNHSVFVNLDLQNIILSVGSLYCPPRADFEVDLNDWNSATHLSQHCLTLGDFNAHDPLWGYSREDARGRLLIDFVLANCLVVLNDRLASRPMSQVIDLDVLIYPFVPRTVFRV